MSSKNRTPGGRFAPKKEAKPQGQQREKGPSVTELLKVNRDLTTFTNQRIGEIQTLLAERLGYAYGEGSGGLPEAKAEKTIQANIKTTNEYTGINLLKLEETLTFLNNTL